MSKRMTRSQSIYINQTEMLYRRITRSNSIFFSQPSKVNVSQSKRSLRRTTELSKKDEKRSAESDYNDKSQVEKDLPKILSAEVTGKDNAIGVKSKTPKKGVNSKEKTKKELLPETSSAHVIETQNETRVTIKKLFSTTAKEIQHEVASPIVVHDEESKATSFKRKCNFVENSTTPSRRSLRLISKNESCAPKQTPKAQATINHRRYTVNYLVKKPLNNDKNHPAKLNITCGMNTKKAEPNNQFIAHNNLVLTTSTLQPARRAASKSDVEAASIRSPKNVTEAINTAEPARGKKGVHPKEKTLKVTKNISGSSPLRPSSPPTSSAQVNQIQNETLPTTNHPFSTTSLFQDKDIQNETQVTTNEPFSTTAKEIQYEVASSTVVPDKGIKATSSKIKFNIAGNSTSPSRRSLRLISKNESCATQDTPETLAKINRRRYTLNSFEKKALTVACGMNAKKGESEIQVCTQPTRRAVLKYEIEAANIHSPVNLESVDAAEPVIEEKGVVSKGKTLQATTKLIFSPTSSAEVNEIRNETLVTTNHSLPTTSLTQVNEIQNETQVKTNQLFSTKDKKIQQEMISPTVVNKECKTSIKRKFNFVENSIIPSRRSLRLTSKSEPQANPKFETILTRRRSTIYSFGKKPFNDLSNLPAKLNITCGMNTKKEKRRITCTLPARRAAPKNLPASMPSPVNAFETVNAAEPVDVTELVSSTDPVSAAEPVSTAEPVSAAEPVNKARPVKAAASMRKNSHFDLLIIPHELKVMLVDDAKFIHTQKKLNKINTDLNVAKVINQYVEMKIDELRIRHSSGYAAIQIFDNVIGYFDSFIGKQLLYDEERIQYEEMLQKFPGEAMSKIYPPIYLLRLMVRLNKLLPFSNRDAETLQWMTSHINDLLKYLAENKFILFELNSVL